MKHRVAHVASIVALVLALVVTPAALAGKGGKPGAGAGTSSSISLVLLNSSNGLPHYGQQVTFNISTTATSPWVNLRCYQNGALVGEGWNGYFEGSLTGRNFTLASPKWTGGAADCTAWLKTRTKRGWTALASTSFHVYA